MKIKHLVLINIYVMALGSVFYLMYSLNKNGLPRSVSEFLESEPTQQEQLLIKATRSR